MMKLMPITRHFSRMLAILLSAVLAVHPSMAEAQSLAPLSPGTMMQPSAAYKPVTLSGIELHPQNPFEIDFMIDNGDTQLDINSDAFQSESQKLIQYFLAALTVPEDEMWVNLSPYEADRIIPEGFSQTSMGRDLLAQDYLLKQLSASLMFPDNDTGKRFWEKVYRKAQEVYGTTDLPYDTFHKIWITPDKASLFKTERGVYTVENHLKVMLEQDYLADSHQQSVISTTSENRQLEADHLSTAVMKEIIIPIIEEEVNTGEHFAPLRQIYSAMILATWYKRALKQSVLTQVYADQNKQVGDTVVKRDESEQIYQEYVNAFKEGVYDLIREEVDPITQEIIPRRYFSGGANGYKDVSMAVSDDKNTAYPLVAVARVKSRFGVLGSVYKKISQRFNNIKNDLYQANQMLMKAVSLVETTHQQWTQFKISQRQKKMAQAHRRRAINRLRAIKLKRLSRVMASPVTNQLKDIENYVAEVQSQRFADPHYDPEHNAALMQNKIIKGLKISAWTGLAALLATVYFFPQLQVMLEPSFIAEGPAVFRDNYYESMMNLFNIISGITIVASAGALFVVVKKAMMLYLTYQMNKHHFKQKMDSAGLIATVGPSRFYEDLSPYMLAMKEADIVSAESRVVDMVLRMQAFQSEERKQAFYPFVQFLENLDPIHFVFYEENFFRPTSPLDYSNDWDQEPFARFVKTDDGELLLFVPQELRERHDNPDVLLDEIMAQALLKYFYITYPQDVDAFNEALDELIASIKLAYPDVSQLPYRLARKFALSQHEWLSDQVRTLSFGAWYVRADQDGFYSPLVQYAQQELARIQITAQIMYIVNRDIPRINAGAKDYLNVLLQHRYDATDFIHQQFKSHAGMLMVYDQLNAHVQERVVAHILDVVKNHTVSKVYVQRSSADSMVDSEAFATEVEGYGPEVHYFNKEKLMTRAIEYDLRNLSDEDGRILVVAPLDRYDHVMWQRNLKDSGIYRMVHIDPQDYQDPSLHHDVMRHLFPKGIGDQAWSIASLPLEEQTLNRKPVGALVGQRVHSILRHYHQKHYHVNHVEGLVVRSVVKTYVSLAERIKLTAYFDAAGRYRQYDGLVVTFDPKPRDQGMQGQGSVQPGFSSASDLNALGGIDLSAGHLLLEQQDPTALCDLTHDQQGHCFQWDLSITDLKQMRQQIPGLVPVIINIQPIKSLPLLLGLDDSEEEKQSAPNVDFLVRVD